MKSSAKFIPPVRVFVSYSHKDLFWKDTLIPLLAFSRVNVRPWSDKEIRPGIRWDQEIKRELNEMHVFIALVSVHFSVSKYIQSVECNIAQKRLKRGEIEVLPVYVAPPGGAECDWLMKLQRVPPGEKSWAQSYRDFKEHDLALAPIRDGMRQVIERARKRLLGQPTD